MVSSITIQEVEAMDEQTLRERYVPDFEVLMIKGYRIYLVDVAGHFGYSMIVFGNERQIKWANDYELHHEYFMKSHKRDDLRALYIERAESILFTEEELAQPLKSYSEFERRRKYIMELLPLTHDFMSMFQLQRTPEEKAEVAEKRKKHPIICHAALGWFTEEDREFAKSVDELYDRLMQQMQDTATNYEYQYSAFYYELGNHEYHINTYQGDWDTLSAFGNIPWRGQGAEARELYFADLNFNDVQRKAFNDARAKFLKDAGENDWY